MSDTPVVGKIAFSSVANPNTWDIGESKCLVFASPSEAKRAEELFSAMQRDLTAAQAKLSEVEAEREALKARLEIDPAHPYDGIDCRDQTIKLLEERVDALKEAMRAMKDLRDDLLLRAELAGEKDPDGTVVVDVSRGVWERFNAAIGASELDAAIDAARKK